MFHIKIICYRRRFIRNNRILLVFFVSEYLEEFVFLNEIIYFLIN